MIKITQALTFFFFFRSKGINPYSIQVKESRNWPFVFVKNSVFEHFGISPFSQRKLLITENNIIAWWLSNFSRNWNSNLQLNPVTFFDRETSYLFCPLSLARSLFHGSFPQSALQLQFQAQSGHLKKTGSCSSPFTKTSTQRIHFSEFCSFVRYLCYLKQLFPFHVITTSYSCLLNTTQQF